MYLTNRPDNREYYRLRMLLKGVPDWLVFDITPEDSDRMSEALQQANEERRHDLFCFTTPDRRNVMVSIRDIQAINFLQERAAYRKTKKTQPQFEIYFRDRLQPYTDALDDAEELKMVFDTEEVGLDSFLAFVDGDGEEVYINLKEMMLLWYTAEERVNVTTIYSGDGKYRHENIDGLWEVQVWQEWADDRWYGHVEFIEDDESSERNYEFDTLGPYETKSAAVEEALADFETGRYGQEIREQSSY